MSFEGMESPSKREQLRGNQHRHSPISWQLAPGLSSVAEPRIVQELRRTSRFVSNREESPVSPLYLSCPPNKLHAQCHGRERRLPCQTQPYSAACETPVKGQCQINDSVAAFRHRPLLFQNCAIRLSASSDR